MMRYNQPELTYFSKGLHLIHPKLTVTKQTYETFDISLVFNILKFLFKFKLHGPSMYAIKAKIYGMLYNQASSIAFDETSSYWSALKSS